MSFKKFAATAISAALRGHRATGRSDLAPALRNKKKKSENSYTLQQFVDAKVVRTVGGKGGDGAISFLRLWSNAEAGPDGGDGGNGGHVIFQASASVNNLGHIQSVLKAEDGEKGYNKDCNGKNADHLVIEVPVGTVVKDQNGCVVADLNKERSMFVAARGGAGGHGNHFFISDTMQAPQVAEYGADGEALKYILELQSMANFGLVGFPNAGKSTLLRAISRARPKVASYPFTTLQPHLGVVQYIDYERVTVADLPGLIPGSHRNRGLGITFLKHAERCSALLMVIDLSSGPWDQLEVLKHELSQFSPDLAQRPQIIIGNKIDLPESKSNLQEFQQKTGEKIIPISAKLGINLSLVLEIMREIYQQNVKENE
ncbi:mitochondrial ribosome-associated GTPase 2 isoform X3 [Schistocerca cancellata]|uniref:mitochondrial ribosome-associated GTPase 2 isoform X3 n=1 Tax=Schistocerca cancellata TaxID=274614 RepID=UPI002119566A|nr:mitochondrial ribosome-associated GTPase 2 isoform X3 [Schistocerca cancellata]